MLTTDLHTNQLPKTFLDSGYLKTLKQKHNNESTHTDQQIKTRFLNSIGITKFQLQKFNQKQCFFWREEEKVNKNILYFSI